MVARRVLAVVTYCSGASRWGRDSRRGGPVVVGQGGRAMTIDAEADHNVEPTRRPGLAAVILKVGTLDDPGFFGAPQMAIFTVDKQAFHHVPEGVPSFERMPKR